jgi:SAM-dependent methyltransferase
VTGVDVSEVRLGFGARFADAVPAPGSLRLVRADFYEFAADERFDIVCYFNGFGIGTDADQRRLLRRVRDEWLAPKGVALIDVANPFVWAGWAGDVSHRHARPQDGYRYSLSERTGFDPVGNRFTDTWWETGRPDQPRTQSVRCYTPADFALLLEGTGLTLDGVYVAGTRVESGGDRAGHEADHAGHGELLTGNHEWLAVLRPDR